ncbi:MAG: hypothetical protein ACJ76F_01165 [Bacteroidia bacterium]
MKTRTLIYTTGMVIILFAAWSVSQLNSSVSVNKARIAKVEGTHQRITAKEITPGKTISFPAVKTQVASKAKARVKRHTAQQIKIAIPVIVNVGDPQMAITIKALAKPIEETKLFTTDFLASEEFLLNAEQDTVITGTEGMQIAIKKGSFVDMDGNKVDGKIKFELKEALTHKDIALANLVTKSNKQLLESGGMFYMNATSDGKQVKLAKGQSLMARVPTAKKLKHMKLYQGVKTKDGLNWINPVLLREDETFVFENAFNAKIKNNKQAIVNKEALENADDAKVVWFAGFKNDARTCSCDGTNTFSEDKGTSYLLRTSSLGWANIDRLADDKRTRQIDFVTSIPDHRSYENVYITMIFKYRNIYLPGYRTKSGTYSFTHGDYEKTALPVGEVAIIMATAYKGDQPYFCMKEVLIKNGAAVSLELKETAKTEIEKQLKQLL